MPYPPLAKIGEGPEDETTFCIKQSSPKICFMMYSVHV